jgi:mannose-6-phosphate isomerase-like protein (cupin superfamily)
MIKRAQELKPEVVTGLRGGKGDLTMTKLIEGEQFQGKGRLYAKIVLPPGASIGWHQHTGDAETYYILKGQGTVNDNGVTGPIRAGDVMFTGNGENHSIENTGSEDLEMLALILFV